MGERVIEKQSAFWTSLFLGNSRGVCVGWEVCQGGGLPLSTQAETLYFQQYSLITQAHHRAGFYPHSLDFINRLQLHTENKHRD